MGKWGQAWGRAVTHCHQGLAPLLPLTLMETRQLNSSTKPSPSYPQHQRPNPCSQVHSSPDLQTVLKEILKSKRFMVIDTRLNIILVTITSNSIQHWRGPVCMYIRTGRFQRDTVSSLLIAAFPEKGCLMFINCFTLRNCCEKSPQENRNILFINFCKERNNGKPCLWHGCVSWTQLCSGCLSTAMGDK